MVIDTSALVAILLREPDADRFSQAIAEAPVRLCRLSHGRTLICHREQKTGIWTADIVRALRDARIEIAAVTPQHAEIAIEAFRRCGKGRHRAALNIGDCFSYALSKAMDLPLLFKGDDFIHTDIEPAVTGC